MAQQESSRRSERIRAGLERRRAEGNQVPGEGPFDVVIAPGAVSHVEFQWEAAGQTASLRGVARSCADDPY